MGSKIMTCKPGGKGLSPFPPVFFLRKASECDRITAKKTYFSANRIPLKARKKDDHEKSNGTVFGVGDVGWYG